ncbi:hypothetical protein MJ1_0576 [Nanobdella aerobiophila]|uniref:Polymerase beta nucleotidyltransferase domain-containing protein n=1 Tax=Nanobdella aerobiophila TaxID=2586965 RepID=A0A915SSY9_9ARCH|nr:nucleotidyltransferase domain-containing protein [Nanobdella aerobiophila]BBL45726.1 hypothetical protein MJ1_0576 [Nanobdella aerobiophila]
MINKIIEELHKILDENIEDIIIFGSITRGKENPKDIDILVIFKKITYDVYKKLNLPEIYHINIIESDKLFSLGTLLIEILSEGWSVKYKRPIREILAFKSFKEYIFRKIIYGENKNSKKVSFHFFIYGRKDRNKKGLLEETHAELIRRNPFIIRVPIEYSEIFKRNLTAFIKTKNIEIELEERTVILGKKSIIGTEELERYLLRMY